MNNVISVFGSLTDTYTGLKAERLARQFSHLNRNKSVLFISPEMDKRASTGLWTAFDVNIEFGYDPIRPMHVSVPVTHDEYESNLYHLNLGREYYQGQFTPDAVERVVNGLANRFDYVICDAGVRIEKPLSLGALFSSEHTIFVLNHTKASVERYKWYAPILNKLHINIDSFIIDIGRNKPEYDLSDISGDYALGKDTAVVLLDGNDDTAKFYELACRLDSQIETARQPVVADRGDR